MGHTDPDQAEAVAAAHEQHQGEFPGQAGQGNMQVRLWRPILKGIMDCFRYNFIAESFYLD